MHLGNSWFYFYLNQWDFFLLSGVFRKYLLILNLFLDIFLDIFLVQVTSQVEGEEAERKYSALKKGWQWDM